MEKKNFVTLVMSVIGVILFGIGMCMCLLPQWNAGTQGVAIGVVALVELVATAMVRRKMEGKSLVVHVSGKTVGAMLLGIAGALVLGVGMCMVMVWGATLMIPGIIVGLIGIMALLCLIPLVKGLK